MNSRHVFVMVGGLALGLSCPMAMAMGEDTTNTYFNTNTPMTSRATILEGQTVERSVLIEKTSSSPAVIERTVSAPVIIDRLNASAVVVEDRIIKQKHFFAIGIWPLFNFEVL